MKKIALWKIIFGVSVVFSILIFFERLISAKPWTWNEYAFSIGFYAFIALIGIVGSIFFESRPKFLLVVYWVGMIASILLVVGSIVDVVFWGKKITLYKTFYPFFLSYLAYGFYKLLKNKKIKRDME